jgi:hypothetical protein
MTRSIVSDGHADGVAALAVAHAHEDVPLTVNLHRVADQGCRAPAHDHRLSDHRPCGGSDFRTVAECPRRPLTRANNARICSAAAGVAPFQYRRDARLCICIGHSIDVPAATAVGP